MTTLDKKSLNLEKETEKKTRSQKRGILGLKTSQTCKKDREKNLKYWVEDSRVFFTRVNKKNPCMTRVERENRDGFASQRLKEPVNGVALLDRLAIQAGLLGGFCK